MWAGIACMLGVVCLWGVTPTLIKIALESVGPFSIAFLRLALGTGVLLVVYVSLGGTIRRLFRRDRYILIGGLGVTVNYACFCLSLKFTTAGAGGLIAQVQFVILALLAALVLKEHFRPMKISGMLGVIGGILIIIISRGDLNSAFAERYLLGNIIMVLSGTGWAFYALSNKVCSAYRSSFEVLIPMMAIGMLITGTAALFVEPIKLVTQAKPILAILALGILSTGGGFLLVDAGMRRLSAGLAGTITAITPFFNIVVAHFAIGEPLRPVLFVSGAVIAIGLAGIVHSERQSTAVN